MIQLTEKFFSLEVMPELPLVAEFPCPHENEKAALLEKIIHKIAFLYGSYFTDLGLVINTLKMT